MTQPDSELDAPQIIKQKAINNCPFPLPVVPTALDPTMKFFIIVFFAAIAIGLIWNCYFGPFWTLDAVLLDSKFALGSAQKMTETGNNWAQQAGLQRLLFFALTAGAALLAAATAANQANSPNAKWHTSLVLVGAFAGSCLAGFKFDDGANRSLAAANIMSVACHIVANNHPDLESSSTGADKAKLSTEDRETLLLGYALGQEALLNQITLPDAVDRLMPPPKAAAKQPTSGQ